MNTRKILSIVIMVCILITTSNVAYASETKVNKGASIKQISVPSAKLIKIKFDKTVKPLKVPNIRIYKKVDKKYLKFEISKISDTEINLITDPQEPSTDYIVELSNITDSKGNIVKKINVSFTGFVNIAIKSDLFKISKVEQVSNKQINVYFTQPINAKAEQPAAFSLLQGGKVLVDGIDSGISVMKMEGQNALVICFKNYTLSPNKEYTLKIGGTLLSSYETFLGDGKGDQISFVGKYIKEDSFKFLGVTALSNISVQLDFNKPIDQSTVKELRKFDIVKTGTQNYSLIESVKIVDNSCGKGCGLILQCIKPFDTEIDSKTNSLPTYDVIIYNINDITKQYIIEKQQYTFTPTDKSPDTSKLQIVSAVAINSNTIEVIFDNYLDPTSAQDETNYSLSYNCIYTGNVSSITKIENKDPITGREFPPTQILDTTYKTTNMWTNDKPVSAKISNDNPKSVKLYFRFPMVPDTKWCTLTVKSSLQDSRGSVLPKSMDYSLPTSDVKVVKPEITEAVFIANDTVKVSFNKLISDYGKSFSSSYVYGTNFSKDDFYLEDDSGIKIVPTSVPYIDDNTIVFKFNTIDHSKEYYIKYNKLYDIFENMYSGDNVKIEITPGK